MFKALAQWRPQALKRHLPTPPPAVAPCAPQDADDEILRQQMAVTVERYLFYRDGYHRQARVIAGLVAVLGLCVAALVIELRRTDPEPAYFATTSDLQVIPLHKMERPDFSEAGVASWVSRCLRETFTYHYANYRQHFADIGARCFTAESLAALEKELENANVIQGVVQNRLIANAVVTGAPTLVESGKSGGLISWEFTVPGAVTFANQQSARNEVVTWNVLVSRMPLREAHDGLRIVKLQQLAK